MSALVLLNLLNSLQKRDKMLGKPHILSLFLNSFNKAMSNHVRFSIYCFVICYLSHFLRIW